jgi:hypothetical protein
MMFSKVGDEDELRCGVASSELPSLRGPPVWFWWRPERREHGFYG